MDRFFEKQRIQNEYLMSEFFIKQSYLLNELSRNQRENNELLLSRFFQGQRDENNRLIKELNQTQQNDYKIFLNELFHYNENLVSRLTETLGTKVNKRGPKKDSHFKNKPK